MSLITWIWNVSVHLNLHLYLGHVNVIYIPCRSTQDRNYTLWLFLLLKSLVEPRLTNQLWEASNSSDYDWSQFEWPLYFNHSVLYDLLHLLQVLDIFTSVPYSHVTCISIIWHQLCAAHLFAWILLLIIKHVSLFSCNLQYNNIVSWWPVSLEYLSWM